jgi:hypothetical protein
MISDGGMGNLPAVTVPDRARIPKRKEKKKS